ncbi:MAG: DUF308 domain-containing protein [Eubacteriales bacterium]|nr:DUF308 domain-containing protein [Eubacteriales bacterium]
MKANEKGMPWWLVIVTGVLIIAAGIFLLASNNTDPDASNAALDTLTFLVGLGVLVYGVYCFFKAIQLKNDNRLFIPFLVHGILDVVLFLLILIIDKSPVLLGVILASWLIVFGVFDIIQAKQSGGKRGTRIGALLVLIGLGLMIIPLLLRINYVVFLGIVALVFGIIKTTQGILYKVRLDERTSGGRSNLI